MNKINFSNQSFPAQVVSEGIAIGKILIIGNKTSLEKNHGTSDPSIFLESVQETKSQLKDLALKISKKHKIIGPRQGEKLQEILITEDEKKISQEKTDMWIIQNYPLGTS